MVSFGKKTSYFLGLCCLVLLFIPKINLITFKGRETAGVRVDDFLLLAVSFPIFWAHLALRTPLCTIEKWLFSIVIFGLLSYAINRLFVHQGYLHVDASILYALRILEYFIFFYIGSYVAQHFNVHSIIWAFFIMNFFLMIGQKVLINF